MQERVQYKETMHTPKRQNNSVSHISNVVYTYRSNKTRVSMKKLPFIKKLLENWISDDHFSKSIVSIFGRICRMQSSIRDNGLKQIPHYCTISMTKLKKDSLRKPRYERFHKIFERLYSTALNTSKENVKKLLPFVETQLTVKWSPNTEKAQMLNLKPQ